MTSRSHNLHYGLNNAYHASLANAGTPASTTAPRGMMRVSGSDAAACSYQPLQEMCTNLLSEALKSTKSPKLRGLLDDVVKVVNEWATVCRNHEESLKFYQNATNQNNYHHGVINNVAHYNHMQNAMTNLSHQATPNYSCQTFAAQSHAVTDYGQTGQYVDHSHTNSYQSQASAASQCPTYAQTVTISSSSIPASQQENVSSPSKNKRSSKREPARKRKDRSPETVAHDAGVSEDPMHILLEYITEPVQSETDPSQQNTRQEAPPTTSVEKAPPRVSLKNVIEHRQIDIKPKPRPQNIPLRPAEELTQEAIMYLETTALATRYDRLSIAQMASDAVQGKVKHFLDIGMIGKTDTGFECQEQGCDTTFGNYLSMLRHVLKFHLHDLKPQGCPQCENRFYLRHELNDHIMSQHTNFKRYECDKPGCKFKTNKRREMAAHIDSHEGIKRYACKVPGCEKKFSKVCNLRDHIANHTGARKTFKCPHCDEKRLRKRSLDRHIEREHLPAAQRTYLTCQFCDKKYTDRSTLRFHQRRFHSYPTPLPPDWAEKQKRIKEKIDPQLCPECGEFFEKPFDFRRHFSRRHQKHNYICKECGQQQKSSQALRWHKLQYHTPVEERPRSLFGAPENYLCQTCGEVFQTLTQKRIHETNHNPKNKYKCDDCGYACEKPHKLARHKEKHNDPSQFKTCAECQKVCKGDLNLREHMRKVHEVYENPDTPDLVRSEAEIHYSDHSSDEEGPQGYRFTTRVSRSGRVVKRTSTFDVVDTPAEAKGRSKIATRSQTTTKKKPPPKKKKKKAASRFPKRKSVPPPSTQPSTAPKRRGRPPKNAKKISETNDDEYNPNSKASAGPSANSSDTDVTTEDEDLSPYDFDESDSSLSSSTFSEDDDDSSLSSEDSDESSDEEDNETIEERTPIKEEDGIESRRDKIKAVLTAHSRKLFPLPTAKQSPSEHGSPSKPTIMGEDSNSANLGKVNQDNTSTMDGTESTAAESIEVKLEPIAYDEQATS